jgi:hypothetical protein
VRKAIPLNFPAEGLADLVPPVVVLVVVVVVVIGAGVLVGKPFGGGIPFG